MPPCDAPPLPPPPPPPPPQPTSLRRQCVRFVLRSANQYDADSRVLIAEILVSVAGVDGIIAACDGDARAFAGLAVLPARGDFCVVDDVRRSLAASRPRFAAGFVRGILEDATFLATQPMLGDCASVAKALVGDGRYKRDIVGPRLSKEAADACRAIRNKGDASTRRAAGRQTAAQARRERLLLRVPRGPWFPGYEH